MSDRLFERRKHKRHAVNGILGNVLYSSDLNVVNISIDGVAIETKKRIEINRVYPFKIKYKGFTLNIKGVVVWSVLSHSQKTESGEVIPIYRAGVKFTDAMSEKANVLLKFLEDKVIASSDRRLSGVRCKITNSDEVKIDYPHRYSVREMSLSGMLIETEYPLTPDTQYSMELVIDENVFNIVGKVVSCISGKAENDVKHIAGVEFVDMSEESRELLKTFIHNLEKL